MLTSLFDYQYPKELIATYPPEKRGDSRMMVVERSSGKIWDDHIQNFPQFLHSNDLVIFNNSRVIPARLYGVNFKGKQREFLLLKDLGNDVWECLVSKSSQVNQGDAFIFPAGLKATIENTHDETRQVKFHYHGNFLECLEKIGHMLLPPYIKREDEVSDRGRYQTIFAEHHGSAASPTAGLHFTADMMKSLASKASVGFVTLHVGIGTFFPIRTKHIENHRMHGEFYHMPRTTFDQINLTRKKGGKIIAVGTTTVRVLESADEKEKTGTGCTKKYIQPPYQFRCVDQLLTNFHQPCSTLLVMVSALMGLDLVKKSYQRAIEKKYRLFSYGDCMLIL